MKNLIKIWQCFKFIDETKNGEIKLADAENDQIKFKSNLGKTKKGKNKRAKKRVIQYWNALQSKKQGY